MKRVVVIGAGQAGFSVVSKLRTLGFDGELILVGEEPDPPYQRPPLSKAYLMGEMERERLYFRPEAFYSENAIDLRLGVRVDAIVRDARSVISNGEKLSYDELVLTTGSNARRLPTSIGGDLPGVVTVRTLADIDALEPLVAEGRSALVVGGGYIGLEAAAVCRKKGMSVTLLEATERILQRVAAPETSAFFRDLHASHGVDIREGAALAAITGDGRARSAELADGSTIPCDLAVVGIGISPNDTIAREAGLTIQNGIATDAFGRTSDPNIWAAGDCASFPWRSTHLRLESVQNAIDQAECVAANIYGSETAYEPKPWFWSDQYDVKLQIAGLNTGYDRVIVRPGEQEASVSHWYYCGKDLLAVDSMNDPRAYMVGKRLIEAGRSPTATEIADRSTDLKALLKR